MQRMEMLLSKTPATDVKSDVLPMIYRALESDTAQIQELCLSIIPGFAGTHLDFFFGLGIFKTLWLLLLEITYLEVLKAFRSSDKVWVSFFFLEYFGLLFLTFFFSISFVFPIG